MGRTRMIFKQTISLSKLLFPLVLALGAWEAARGQLVPGTGRPLAQAGDDFEDPSWEYIYNSPKASKEQDEKTRVPAGGSRNGRFFEPLLRGQPDFIERVETPEG